MLSRFHPIPERYGQADGQTDRQTDGQNCYINIARQHIKRDRQYFVHNFDKFKCIVIIFFARNIVKIAKRLT